MIGFLLPRPGVEKKFSHLQKINSVKMRFGCNLLKKLGPNCVEVMKHQKWEDAPNFLKISMELLVKSIGQTTMKTDKVKRNFTKY